MYKRLLTLVVILSLFSNLAETVYAAATIVFRDPHSKQEYDRFCQTRKVTGGVYDVNTKLLITGIQSSSDPNIVAPTKIGIQPSDPAFNTKITVDQPIQTTASAPTGPFLITSFIPRIDILSIFKGGTNTHSVAPPTEKILTQYDTLDPASKVGINPLASVNIKSDASTMVQDGGVPTAADCAASSPSNYNPVVVTTGPNNSVADILNELKQRDAQKTLVNTGPIDYIISQQTQKLEDQISARNSTADTVTIDDRLKDDANQLKKDQMDRETLVGTGTILDPIVTTIKSLLDKEGQRDRLTSTTDADVNATLTTIKQKQEERDRILGQGTTDPDVRALMKALEQQSVQNKINQQIAAAPPASPLPPPPKVVPFTSTRVGLECQYTENIGIFGSGTGIATAIGCIPTKPTEFIAALLRLTFAVVGGISFLLMIGSVFQMITSGGNPDSLKQGHERFTSAVIGLLFVIFAVLLLRIIGVDILNIGPALGL